MMDNDLLWLAENDRILGSIITDLDIFNHEELALIAASIRKAGAASPAKPIEQLEDQDLRRFILVGARYIHRINPQALRAVGAVIDQITTMISLS